MVTSLACVQLPTLAVAAMAVTNTPVTTCVAPVAVRSWEIPAGMVPLVVQPAPWVAAPSRYLSPLAMTGVTLDPIVQVAVLVVELHSAWLARPETPWVVTRAEVVPGVVVWASAAPGRRQRRSVA